MLFVFSGLQRRSLLDNVRLITPGVLVSAATLAYAKVLPRFIIGTKFSTNGSNEESKSGWFKNSVTLSNNGLSNGVTIFSLSNNMLTPFIDSCQTLRKFLFLISFLVQLNKGFVVFATFGLVATSTIPSNKATIALCAALSMQMFMMCCLISLITSIPCLLTSIAARFSCKWYLTSQEFWLSNELCAWKSTNVEHSKKKKYKHGYCCYVSSIPKAREWCTGYVAVVFDRNLFKKIYFRV